MWNRDYTKHKHDRYMKKILLLLFLLVGIAAKGAVFVVDGIAYNITSADNKTVEVKRGGQNYSGDIVIPSSIEYEGIMYSVTKIGSNAFYRCKDVTSVVIPESVTYIDYNAFEDCTGLTEIAIPASVTTIASDAFWGCNNLMVVINDSNLTITKGATSNGHIAYYAGTIYEGKIVGNFVIKDGTILTAYRATDATQVVVPDYITSIEGAFCFHDELTSITIPEGLTNIGNNSFKFCESLTSITIPKGVTNIGNEAFYYCKALKSVAIPSGVESIGDWAFAECSNKMIVRSLIQNPSKANSAFENLTIYVPGGTTEVYKTMWGKSNQYIEDATPIEVIKINNNTQKTIYDLMGHSLSEPKRGVNIINGKKVLVQ